MIEMVLILCATGTQPRNAKCWTPPREQFATLAECEARVKAIGDHNRPLGWTVALPRDACGAREYLPFSIITKDVADGQR